MMKHPFFNRLVSFSVCLVLIAALALSLTSCGKTDKPTAEPGVSASALDASGTPVSVGQGATAFTFEVVDATGAKSLYDVHTDETTVGAALPKLGLIAGEDGAYGLYVKTVNGITVDYVTDGAYWAFYENGRYAACAVDTANITPGGTYSFKVEK